MARTQQTVIYFYLMGANLGEFAGSEVLRGLGPCRKAAMNKLAHGGQSSQQVLLIGGEKGVFHIIALHRLVAAIL